MSTSQPSVGRMIASGLAAVPAVNRKDAPRTRHEAMARGMLDHLLRDRRARRAFTRRIARIDTEVPTFRTTTRTGPTAYDLIAQAPAEGKGEGTLGVKLVVDGEMDAERIRELLDGFRDHPGNRLLLVIPRSRRQEIAADDDRLRIVTWAQVVKRMSAKDEERAELWRALGEFGENEAVPDAHQPVSPAVLLDREVTEEFRAHLQAMLLVSRELMGRAPRFSSSRSHPRAWLHVGGSASDLGVEFDAVEDGSAIWLVGRAPIRSFSLGIGALPDETARADAEKRVRAIAAQGDWRHDPSFVLEAGAFIGTPATRTIEDARSLLWEVLDPARLEGAGFPLVPRQQPDLEENRLAVRVHAPGIPRSGTFLVSIGGSSTWRTLLPRVTREYDGRTYVIQAKKTDTAQDLVSAVHKALRSLATKP